MTCFSISRALATALVTTMFWVVGTVSSQAQVEFGQVRMGLPNTTVVTLSGSLEEDEILKFKSFISNLPSSERVVVLLNSPGGSVFQGQSLGRYFYDARITTVVLSGAKCQSACTDVFLGGRDLVSGRPLRILATGGILGFHNFRSVDVPEKSYTKSDLEDVSRAAQVNTYEQLEYLESVDVPLDAVLLQLGTKAEDMHNLREADALDLGIAILNHKTGKLTSPTHLAKRMRTSN